MVKNLEAMKEALSIRIKGQRGYLDGKNGEHLALLDENYIDGFKRSVKEIQDYSVFNNDPNK